MFFGCRKYYRFWFVNAILLKAKYAYLRVGCWSTDLRIVARMATVAGIASAGFSILSAALSYGLLASATSHYIHLSTIRLTVWSAMLPYLLASVVFFTIAAFTSRVRGALKPDPTPMMTDTQKVETQK